MGTCPTRYGFIQELTDEYNLTPEQKIAAAKVYEKLKSIKIGNSLEVQKTSRTLPRKYYTALNAIVKQGLGPKVTTSEYLGLSKAVVGAIDIVAGQTRNNKNIVLSKTPRQDALKAQAEGIFEAWYTEKSPYATQFVDLDEEAFVDVLRNDEIFQQNKENETTKIMAEALAGFAKINGMHTLAHEMVHVGAVEFMKENPTHEYTRRVNSLYQEALVEKTKILKHMGKGRSEYWTTSVDEFLAEALSNPDLVFALTNTRTEGKEKYSTLFRNLLHVLLSMVGIKTSDNMYTYVLDGYLAMVEHKANSTEYAKKMDELVSKLVMSNKEEKIDKIDEEKKLSDKLYTSKVDSQEVDSELLLGDDAMKDYKPKKEETKQGTDVTEQFTNIIGNRVAVNYNGAIAVDRMISKIVDMGDYVTAVLEHDGKYETYKFANGEKTGTSEKGIKVTINDMDKFTSFVLGNKKKDDKANWDNLKEQTDYVHGDKDSMKEMLNTLHTLGGKKATAEDMEYYETLIDSMNSEFFNKMKLYLKNTSRESAGQVKRYRLDFAVSKAPMLAGNQQTEAEIYLHEVVHTMVKFARMSNTLESRRIERELEHVIAGARTRITWKAFLPEVSINAKLEEANAKEMFEYIFNSENYVDEFIAHVLTNPQLRKVAEKIHLNTTEAKSLLDRAVDLFKTLMDVVLGNYKFKEKNNTIYDQVKGLAIQLGEINAHANRAAESEKGMLAVGMDMLNKLDDKAAAKLNELKDKYLVDNERLEDYPKNSSKAVKAAWMLKVLKKSAINEDYGKALGLVMTSYGIKPDGIIRNVLNDFKEPSDFEKTVEWLQLASDKVEGERNSVISAGKKLVVAGFKKKLNKAEEKALLRTVLDLDMQVLLEQGYSIGDVRRLLEDKDLLDKEIGKAKHELELLDKKYYNWHTTQATGLGYYLATHKATPAQNFNAFNIARGLISNHYKRPEKDVVQAIDKVATLVGMYYTDPRQKEIAAGLFKEEYKGVQNLMAIHRGYNAESKRTLFSGNETQMIKGYSKEIFDDSIETQVAPLEEREELEQAGYIFKGELKGKYGDSTAVPMGLFVSSSFSRNELLRGATRLTKMGARGTTLTETKYNDGGDFAKERAARDIVRMDIERLKIVKQMLEGTFDATTAENGIAPVLDAEGNVVNYRYMMDKEMKEDVLKQDTSVSEIMGRTQGAMLDKLESKKHNVFVLKNILDNMAKNWTSGLLGNDGLTEYTLITPNSTNQEIKELYRILPKEFKAAINARPDKTLAIPTSMKALYFGYRHLSIVDVPGIKILPKVMLQIIKMMEAMWIEIVKIAKTNILLKVPNVAISNMISNIMRGINIGIDPVTLMKTYVDSFRDVRAHVKKHRELVALQLKQTSGRATRNDKDRIKALEKELKSNPVHELMVKGFYQAFQEDVENAELRSSNKVKKWIDEQVENVPGVIKTPMQWLYLSEETAFYKASQELMQMSDLVSRVVEIRHLDMLSEKQANGKRMMPQWWRDENPTKEKTIKLLGSERNKFLKRAHELNLYATLQAYINYNKPSSQVEDYLDRTGSIRFTKFVKRIQLVNAKTTIEHPIKTALLALTKAFVWNVDNTFDQSLFMKQWYTRGYGPGNIVPLYSPLDTISTAAEPGLIKLVTG